MSTVVVIISATAAGPLEMWRANRFLEAGRGALGGLKEVITSGLVSEL